MRTSLGGRVCSLAAPKEKAFNWNLFSSANLAASSGTRRDLQETGRGVACEIDDSSHGVSLP